MGSSTCRNGKNAKDCSNVIEVLRMKDFHRTNFREISNCLKIVFLQPFRYNRISPAVAG